MMLNFRPFGSAALSTNSYTRDWNQLQTIHKATQEMYGPYVTFMMMVYTGLGPHILRQDLVS